MARKIGIDLGTANVLVYVKGKGIVLSEPSVVALSTKDNRVKAVGADALAMLGREPESIEVVRPMRNGVIADYDITEAMLSYFIKKTSSRFNKPEVMICIPAGVTTVEMRAVREAALSAGARHAYLIREPLAAAIGANIPVAQPSGNLIIDIGGGTTEVAVISLNDIVVSTSVRVGGNKFDEAIASYIKRKYNVLIGERTAESVKIEIGAALPLERPLTMQVRGRDQVAGLPRTIEINSNEITEAIQEPLEAVVNATRMVLSETPPELSSDIIDKGMVMTGGGSMLRRINELLTEVTGVPCYVADQPANCVAIGTGLALEHIDILRDSLSGDDLN
jgi:rod shape-determining protein MreB